MSSRTRAVIIVGILGLIALIGGYQRDFGSQSENGRGNPAPTVPEGRRGGVSPPFAGRASCSGRACHGALQPATNGVQLNEFTTWITCDKHAHAFDALKSERARQMAKNLGIASAETDVRCLACHVTPQLASDNTPEAIAMRSDGVSCEACHGPAKGTDPWLTAHTLTSWKELSGKEKLEAYHRHGMTPMFDLEVQAKTCAGCHIGAPADPEHGIPARDLNHDLMAAGHPRLMFELSTYRDNLPPHWRLNKHAGTPGYEVSIWAVGQVASAQASVDLLEYRAKAVAEKKAPWPEFAEAGCFSCHADFQSPSWRRNPAFYSGRTLGAISYNRWYAALMPVLESVAVEKTASAEKAMDSLAAAMNKPHPEPAKIAALAATAHTDLGTLLSTVENLSYNAETVKALAEGLAKRTEKLQHPDWDELTQIALAAAALREASAKTRNPEALKPLDDIFRELAFPASYESPQGYTPRSKAENQTDDLQARLAKVLHDMARSQ